MPTVQIDYIAYQLAVEMNLVPQEDAKFDALELGDNNFNFRLAKRFGDNTNILIEVDGEEMK